MKGDTGAPGEDGKDGLDGSSIITVAADTVSGQKTFTVKFVGKLTV